MGDPGSCLHLTGLGSDLRPSPRLVFSFTLVLQQRRRRATAPSTRSLVPGLLPCSPGSGTPPRPRARPSWRAWSPELLRPNGRAQRRASPAPRRPRPRGTRPRASARLAEARGRRRPCGKCPDAPALAAAPGSWTEPPASEALPGGSAGGVWAAEAASARLERWKGGAGRRRYLTWGTRQPRTGLRQTRRCFCFLQKDECGSSKRWRPETLLANTITFLPQRARYLVSLPSVSNP